MKLLTKKLEDSHNLFLFGDKHDGSMLSSQTGWKKLINMMHSRYDGCINNYGVDVGDIIEAIMVDDKRFYPEKPVDKDEAVIPSAIKQIDKAVEIREPIKESLLLMLDGNHPRKLWRFGNLTADACKRLGVEYGTYTAKLTITDSSGNLMYKTYATHGFKNITSTADDPKRRRSNMELILKRHLRFKAGDCAVMVKGHTHKLLVCKPESELFLTDDGHKIKQNYTGWGQNEDYIHPDARWYGNTGSFLKLHGEDMSGYAEIMEYDPIELGFLILKVRKRKIIELEPYYLKI
ncbi:hypothetical protein LCGC14_0917420 [marine sediment metagenome]|uniref:Uncharacterized protein n=1 Tax=marine sediment metagenome TaxID=412755 RepID=A0A0F9RAG8_9ZZZZ